MTTHMARKDAAAPGHVCPGIRIHAIDIVQPPGIGMVPIADIDAHHPIVIAALTAKSSVETPRKVRSERWVDVMGRLGSALVVLVVTPPPDALLVAPQWSAIEPLVHPPDAVQSARVA